MAASNIGRRRLAAFVAGFAVVSLVSLGFATKAQDRNTCDEAVAALAEIDSATGELSESSDLTASFCDCCLC